ncbi:hypothetical protein HK103_000896 [Boothiomyces macroporosus]|uniref:Uncharacterized protein n=1 Tax=Boothiomyces macroporosus TaxID=261099 RepID=A0AAD5Y5P4_9FUNG|nr:hypothetical protein HK103_000896 [Boothiomyces macroporosus]
MNSLFEVQPIHKVLPIQSLYPPKPVTVPGSNLSNEHVSSFSTRITEDEADDKVIQEQRPATSLYNHSRWTLDIPITIRQFTVQNGKQVPSEIQKTVRLIIISDFDRPFPQAHKIVIMDPIDDIFFHWTFNCNPFSFKSILKQMKWRLPTLAGNGFQETFRRFGYMIQQIANNVASNPNAFKAVLQVNPNQQVASLKLLEIVKEYRKIDLVEIEFTPSAWNDVKKDILDYTSTIQKEYDEINDNLIQVMNTVSIHQPAILLSSSELYNHEVNIDYWKTQDKLFASAANARRKQEDRDDKVVSDPIHSKTIPVPTTHPDGTETTRQLTFTFYYLNYENKPPIYRITITDSQDIFFHFTSIDITPQVFHDMISNIELDEKYQSKKTLAPLLSRTVGKPKDPHVFAFNRNAKVGFHDPKGAEGVIGVISGDYMTGCVEQRDRYNVQLAIELQREKEKGNECSELMKKEVKPDQLKATLIFTEYLYYQIRSGIQVEFNSTDYSVFQDILKKKYSSIKNQIQTCRKRLDSILTAVNQRNHGLFVLLDRPNKNIKFENGSIPRTDVSHGHGYEYNMYNTDSVLVNHQAIPIPKPERMAEKKLNISVIPSRPVYYYNKIPVQTQGTLIKNTRSTSRQR